MNFIPSSWNHKQVYIINRNLYKCQKSKRFSKNTQLNTVAHFYSVDLVSRFFLLIYKVVKND